MNQLYNGGLSLKRRLHLQQILNVTCNATRYFSNTCCELSTLDLRNATATLNKTPFRILGMFSYLIKFVGCNTNYTNKRFSCGHYGIGIYLVLFLQ